MSYPSSTSFFSRQSPLKQVTAEKKSKEQKIMVGQAHGVHSQYHCCAHDIEDITEESKERL